MAILKQLHPADIKVHLGKATGQLTKPGQFRTLFSRDHFSTFYLII